MPLKNAPEIVLAVAFAALACATAAEAAGGGFRFRRDIDLGNLERQGPVAVTLDGDVYTATRDGFPDLGVFDAEGRRVPCLVEKAEQSCTRRLREPCPIEVIRRPEQKERVRLLVVLAAGAAAKGLSIFTPEKNYECLVRVLGSIDAKRWMPLVEDGLVFDYSRYLDLANREVALPRNKCRHFAIDVIHPGEGDESLFAELTRRYAGGAGERPALPRRPFQLDHVELWHERTETRSGCDAAADYGVVLSHVEDELTSRLTLVYIHSRREPLTELTIETPAGNFTRAVRIEKPWPAGGVGQWTDVAQGEVTQLDFGGYHRRALQVPFPEQREQDYRLVIYNGDDPPLGITDVRRGGTSIGRSSWRRPASPTASNTARPPPSGPRMTPRPSGRRWASRRRRRSKGGSARKT